MLQLSKIYLIVKRLVVLGTLLIVIPPGFASTKTLKMHDPILAKVKESLWNNGVQGNNDKFHPSEHDEGVLLPVEEIPPQEQVNSLKMPVELRKVVGEI